MTDGLFPQAVFELLTPESVSPGVVFLIGPDAPSRVVLAAGGGAFAIHKGFETVGISLLPDKLSAEGVAAAWDTIGDENGMEIFASGFEQASKFATKNAEKLGIEL
jgi:hypothetical protein